MNLKTTLLTILLLTTSTVFGQTKFGTSKTVTGDFGFAFDGEKLCWCSGINVGNDGKVTIYDENMDELTSFIIKNVGPDGKYEFVGLDTSFSGNGELNAYESVYVTRGVFTNDNKWCYCLADENGKMYVYNEDGNLVGELPFNLDDYAWPEFHLSNVYSGKPFISITTFPEGEESAPVNYIWSFYGTSGTWAPTVKMQVRAYPNPLPGGEPLTIELPEPAGADTFVCINDLRGRQVFRRRVNAGETSFKVHNRFSHGAYVYTVINKSGVVASGKLLAE